MLQFGLCSQLQPWKYLVLRAGKRPGNDPKQPLNLALVLVLLALVLVLLSESPLEPPSLGKQLGDQVERAEAVGLEIESATISTLVYPVL